jgi:predicted glycosyltransferase
MSRLLFCAHNRRGLGHLMRGLNIARAIAALAPRADQRFFTRSASAEMLCRPQFGCVVDTNDDWYAGWSKMLRSFAPDVTIYDTLLPAETPPAVGRSVYVMRSCKEERQALIFASPFLATVDRVIIPHTPEEFGHQLPAALRSRARFVGPIVRPLDTATQAALRARYGLAAGQAPLVSTAGGAGFGDDAATFFAMVVEAHRCLVARGVPTRHIVVRGPHYHGELPDLPGMTVVDHEPELGNLLAIAGLVIAQGGYNTVNELRLARTPAVFLPGERSYDDQAARVRALEARGAAAVFTDRSLASVAPRIAAIAADPARLAAMRLAYGPALESGNRGAAAAILELMEG